MSRYKLEFYEFVGCIVFQDTCYAEDQKTPDTYLTANEACDLLNELLDKLEAAEDHVALLSEYEDIIDKQRLWIQGMGKKIAALESALQYYKAELAIAKQRR